jgi:hypothetical protein
MKTKTKISLPEGFEETELPSVTFEMGDKILDYCRSCTKKPNCKMNQTLRYAMGEDFPYWSERFIAVDVPTPHKFNYFDDSEIKVFCADYESPQLKLPGIPRAFSDGVERLIEVAEREKAKYIETNGSALEDNSF